MIKKILIALILPNIFLFAKPIVTVSKPLYSGAIYVNIVPNTWGKKDWIAIYPKDASNSWSNVITWEWVETVAKMDEETPDIVTYVETLEIKKPGNYQVRYFENNSFKTYKAFDFTIQKKNINLGSLDVYYKNGDLTFYANSVSPFDNIILTPNPKDWIGLYKKGDSNAWSNVITWHWVKDFEDIEYARLMFTESINLDKGEYEARYFLNNSFTTYKKSKPFKVETSRSRITAYYASVDNELYITKKNSLTTNPKDWLGVYKKGDSNSWSNVRVWIWAKDIDGVEPGNQDQTYKEIQAELSKGTYELRYFLNNTFKTYESVSFTVK